MDETQVKFNGPAQLDGSKREEYVILNENCNSENVDYNRQSNNWFNRIKKTFFKNVKLITCIVIGIILTILLCSLINKQKTDHYESMNGKYCNPNNPINLTTLNYLNRHITNFRSRNQWDDSDRLKGIKNISLPHPHVCSYNCDAKQKSKIRFVTVNDRMLGCFTNFLLDGCKLLLLEKLKEHVFDLPNKLNDIYYNYLISGDGRIFEGRSLLCPFDEPHLPEDHSSIIIVGIPYCFPSNSELSRLIKAKVPLAVKEIIDKLSLTGLLTEKYSLEFPFDCTNYIHQLYYTIKNNEISFYKNDFLHMTSYWNQEVIRNLLFLPEKDETDLINRSGINVLPCCTPNPNPDEDLCKNGTSIVQPSFDKLIIKFYKLDSLLSLEISDKDDKCFVGHKPDVVKVNRIVEDLRGCNALPESTNYLILKDFDYVLYKVYPLNVCSLNQSSNENNKDRNFEVKILVVGNTYFCKDDLLDWNLEFFPLELSKLTKEIAKDVRRFINYNDVSIESDCGPASDSCSYLETKTAVEYNWYYFSLTLIYDMITDSYQKPKNERWCTRKPNFSTVPN